MSCGGFSKNHWKNVIEKTVIVPDIGWNMLNHIAGMSLMLSRNRHNRICTRDVSPLKIQKNTPSI
jgi:hypothetical protein